MVFEERVGDRGQKGQRILNFLRVRICACVRKAFLENLCPQCPFYVANQIIGLSFNIV